MGERIERATRGVAIAAALVLALGVASAAGGWSDDGDDEARVKGVQLRQPETTTTTRATTSTTGPPATPSTTDAPATTTTAAPQPTTTATAVPPRPVCLDSTDPACGAFGWASAPAANDPLALTVTMEPRLPKAGQKVSFTIVASDPDAPVRTTQIIRFGDGEEIGTTRVARCPERYGPWTLPPETPGASESVVRHTYATPGTYRVEVAAESGEECAPNLHPYASEATVTITFHVNE